MSVLEHFTYSCTALSYYLCIASITICAMTTTVNPPVIIIITITTIIINIIIPTPLRQDSLQLAAQGNSLAGEQTWPSAGEMTGLPPSEDPSLSLDRDQGRDRRVLPADMVRLPFCCDRLLTSNDDDQWQ
jgi:hypothetical protein